MFTGIIEDIGTIQGLTKKSDTASLVIQSGKIIEGTKLGDSIAINGACLTVTGIQGRKFTADLSLETLNKTNLKDLRKGSKVNLERAMVLGGRLGGHLVSGHIDTTGDYLQQHMSGDNVILEFRFPTEYRKYLIQKGSVAIDGISLTVADINSDRFEVWVIPHTLANTTLPDKKPGETVNLEFDLIGKYIENFVHPGKTDSKIDRDYLTEHGFI